MRLQDYIIESTRSAANAFFKAAKAIPADKFEWSPLDNGRSALDLCRECAKCPDWALSIISGEPMPEWNEESQAAMKAEQADWTTAERCEQECNSRLEKLFAYYQEMPDERLSEKKWLPYDGGRDFAMPEMMEYPHWNFNYHEGQLNYIQTLYGDKDMH